MTASFEIRDARPDELAQVSRVLSDSYREYERPDPAWEEYARDVADVWSRLGDSTLIVAAAGDSIRGAVTFYPEGYGHLVDGWPPGWPGIRLLGVHPDARARGIGRALTEECIRRARDRGAAAIALHTTDAMAVARGMYERMGFRRSPDFDFTSGPVLVMAYRLPL